MTLSDLTHCQHHSPTYCQVGPSVWFYESCLSHAILRSLTLLSHTLTLTLPHTTLTLLFHFPPTLYVTLHIHSSLTHCISHTTPTLPPHYISSKHCLHLGSHPIFFILSLSLNVALTIITNPRILALTHSTH